MLQVEPDDVPLSVPLSPRRPDSVTVRSAVLIPLALFAAALLLTLAGVIPALSL
jgi:hypothetical protein